LTEALSRQPFGISITLPFVLGFQAGPFVGVNYLEIGSLEFAVGCQLRLQQRRVRPANTQFGMLSCFRINSGAHR